MSHRDTLRYADRRNAELPWLNRESVRDRGIARRIRGGDTYEAIGSDHGITRQRVQQIAESHGVRPLRVGERPLNAYELQVAQLLESEPRLSYQEVADQSGLSPRQVRRIAERADVAWMRLPVYRRDIQPWDYDEKPDTGCWIWRHGKSSQGHGRLNVGQGRSEYAHRFAYERRYGEIPFRRAGHPPLRQLRLRQSGTPQVGG